MAPKSKKWKSIGKVAGTLLAATCLTVASGTAARADAIYTEGSNPPISFATSGPGTPLPAAFPGVTTVNGDLSYNSSSDWFELTGLGNGTFTVYASASTGGSTGFTVGVSVFSDQNLLTALESQNVGTGGSITFNNPLNIPIPSDHNVVFNVTSGFANGNTESGLSYVVKVDATQTTPNSVPEPSTLEMLGTGLMGAFGFDLMRRKKNQEEKG